MNEPLKYIDVRKLAEADPVSWRDVLPLAVFVGVVGGLAVHVIVTALAG